MMLWLAILFFWFVCLFSHPVATIFITFLLLGVIGACLAGGWQGDGTQHHGGRWLS